eukprot:jgi/Bigna1/86998/estExt_fgenesh1_pg.C_150260
MNSDHARFIPIFLIFSVVASWYWIGFRIDDKENKKLAEVERVSASLPTKTTMCILSDNRWVLRKSMPSPVLLCCLLIMNQVVQAITYAAGSIVGRRFTSSSKSTFLHRKSQARGFSVRRLRRLEHHSPRATTIPTIANLQSVSKIPDFMPEPASNLVEQAYEFFQSKGLTDVKMKPAMLGGRMSMISTEEIPKGEPILSVPSMLCITKKDVEDDPLLKELSEGQDTLTSLALWIMRERALGQDSKWVGYFKTLPLFTYSPITWTSEERNSLLQGSFIKEEANQRVQALEKRWIALEQKIDELISSSSSSSSSLDALRGGLTFQAFVDAFSVVLAHGVYLESVKQVALVPLTELLPRVVVSSSSSSSSSSSTGGTTLMATLDYDQSKDAVVLTADTKIGKGDEIYVTEPVGMSNAELLLTKGYCRSDNPDDFVTVQANVVMADALYTAKKQILDAYNMSEEQTFLVYKDRLPLELLSYLRLSRLQNTDELLKLDFEGDKPISEMNEYEILQLLLTEARMISAGYRTPDTDSDRFVLKDMESSVPAKLAALLRIGEKQVVSSFMDTVRTRLAPIRGIPTKKGMENQNQEILDMFETFESLPSVPGKAIKSFTNWWTDENNWKDPDEDDSNR